MVDPLSRKRKNRPCGDPGNGGRLANVLKYKLSRRTKQQKVRRPSRRQSSRPAAAPKNVGFGDAPTGLRNPLQRLDYSFADPETPGPGQVAQLVEHRTENPSVGGSTPPLTTHEKRRKAPENKALRRFFVASRGARQFCLAKKEPKSVPTHGPNSAWAAQPWEIATDVHGFTQMCLLRIRICVHLCRSVADNFLNGRLVDDLIVR